MARISNTQKKELLQLLIKLRDNGPDDTKSGICENIDNAWINDHSLGMTYAYALIPIVARGWEHHSGDEQYPVPSTDKRYRTAEDYFEAYSSNKWTHRQGELRKNLVNYMINKLEGELK